MKLNQYSFFYYKSIGVVGICLFQAEDSRGRMIKDYSEDVFSRHGIAFCVKESMMISSKKSVLRGLHFQETHGQPKIVQCLLGNIWAVAVDVNPARQTFGQWEPIDMNHGKAVYIPGDYALGTLALEDSVIVCKCGEKYYEAFDTGVKWDDPDIGIKWPLHLVGKPITSARDDGLRSLREYAGEHGGKEKDAQ